MDKNTDKRITDLENKLRLLENSSTIPLNIDSSFMGRGFLKVGNLEQPDGYVDNDGFVTGGAGGTPSIPVRYVRILNINGQNWWIPVYTYTEIQGVD